MRQHSGSIRCVASSKDGAYIATGGQDGLVMLYEFRGSLSIAQKYVGHSADVTSVAFTCDNVIISASLDSTVRLWHPSQLKELTVCKHSEGVIYVTAHPTDSSIFISCTFGNSILLWSIGDNEIIQTLDFVSPPTAAAFSPDGSTIAIGCSNGFCFFYALPDFRYVAQFIAGPRKKKKASNQEVTSIEFVSPGRVLVSTNDSRIRLYSSDTFTVIRKYLGHVCQQTTQRLSVSPDRNLVLIGSEKSGGVFIWPIEHEPHFKGRGLTAFSRERSQTAEGFLLGKKVTVTGALFTGQHSMKHMSLIVTASDGHMFLVLSS
jgi:WD40 repeat protein